MRIYTVHELAGPAGADADVFLIKEGFCWPALVFSFLWAFYHRLWLVLLGLVALTAVLVALHLRLDLSGEVAVAGVLGMKLVLGFFGNDLRRGLLALRGVSFSGVVSGRDAGEAERRLFTVLGPRIYLP